MADSSYSTQNFVLKSHGVMARYAVDAPPDSTFYLNQNNLEEVEESALATRLGTSIINKVGTAAAPLSGAVHSLSRLPGLNNQSWRYASSGGNLYRLSGIAPGSYVLISNSLSGQPWTAVQYAPSISSAPYEYIADANGVIKDNGTLAAPQNAGILQPQYPAIAQAQNPDVIVLDSFRGVDSHVLVNVTSYSPNYAILVTNTTTPIAVLGIQEVGVASPELFSLFDSVVVDTGLNEETVIVIEITANGFVANFTKTHLAAVSLQEFGLSGNVAPSTTGSVSLSFAGHPINTWPTQLSPEDYIKLNLFLTDPSTIQTITLKFDCGDGSFLSDFFWRTIGQGALQSFLDANTDSSTAAADTLLSNTLGVYSNQAGGVSGLNTGQNQWTSLLMQLSDFSSTGRAAFDDPVFNWQNVNGYQIEITTNSSSAAAVLFKLTSLQLVGGAGPDSFAGVSYDYVWTFFNIVDYTESNPSMIMSDVDPPLDTNRVLPRRQPVLLTMNHFNTPPIGPVTPNLDPQTTHIRVYRRGGTLADNYRRIAQIPCSGTVTTFLDTLSDLDIQGADTVSFTNDVPVTSSLPVPVNTELSAATTANSYQPVSPVSMDNISVNQQVSLGDVTSSTFETVIVQGIKLNPVFPHQPIAFFAYVQNVHDIGEAVSATAKYAQPVGIVAVAFDQGWYAEDPNNPSYLYYTPKGAIQYVSSAAFVPVSVPSDAITAIVPTSGNLFVSTQLRWWSIAPGSNANAQPTVYPTRADHGCVGKNAWCLKDGIVYFLAVDGPRVFVGGDTKLISEIIQFVWQGIGPTPIPVALPSEFANARVSYWNQFVIFSYTYEKVTQGDHEVVVTQAQARLILDVEQKRWRNDDVDAQSMFFEQDTNTLVFGDSQGLVHLDRQPVAYDEASSGGAVVQNPIPLDLQTPYNDQTQPAYQKNYNEFTLDANTNGTPVTVTLNFNDGESFEILGPITTTERQRINLNLNNGDGFQAYKVAMQLTTDPATAGLARVLLYQAKLKSIVLAMTRQSLDTYWNRFSDDGSKIAKNLFVEYTASSPITGKIYYDGSSIPGFTFTLPQYNGVRNSLRVRLPAVQFRLARMILTSPGGDDFQIWDESRWEIKPLCQGKGYQFHPLFV